MAEALNGETTHFTWDQALELPQLLATSDGTRYLHGLGLAAVQHAGAWYYPHTDALGSIRRWSDAGGQMVGARDYDPYGAITQQQGVIPTPLGFAGEWHDRATGLQYLRARWYQPETGRFTQTDPFPGALPLPATQHPYQYALNNPLRYTDPSGEFPFMLLAAAALYAAGGAAYYNFVPDVAQGFTPWHLLGYFMGYENIRKDWRTLQNPCASGLAKAWAVFDTALNVTLGVTMVYGWLNTFRAMYAAGQLLRTGAYGGAILQWGDDFFRPLGSNVIRAPQVSTRGLKGLWNHLRLLGGIAHEYAHYQQEFKILTTLLPVTKLLQRLSKRTTDIFGQLAVIVPTYVMNPVEIHAAASGLVYPANWSLLVLDRAWSGLFTYAPEVVSLVSNFITDFSRGPF